MSFDPYYQWLGIPPQEQPPNYYRLLGVALFEPDSQVIASAADRQTAFLRSQGTGSQRRVAERLIKEVATARFCLLTPVQRRAYDEYLRQKLGLPAVTTSVPAATVAASGLVPMVPGAANVLSAPSALASAASPIAENSASPSGGLSAGSDAEPAGEPAPPVPAEEISPQWRRRANQALLVAGCIAGLLLIAAATIVARDIRRARSQPKIEIVDVPRETVEKRPDTEATNNSQSQTAHIVSAGPSPAEPPPSESMPPDNAAVSSARPSEPPAAPSPRDPAAESSPPKPSETVQAKLPVPSVDEQAAALKLAEETYQLSKQRSPEENRLLAEEMVRVAERAECLPAERFVLMRKAAEKYAEAGEVDRMLNTIDSLAGGFQFDRTAANRILLERVSQSVSTAEGYASLVAASRRFCSQALAEERVSEAVQVAAAVQQAGTRLGSKPFRKEVAERAQQLAKLYDRYQMVMGAKRTLRNAADDAKAHDVVGWWYAGPLNRWADALPHFAQGSDSALAEIAKEELNAPPSDAESRMRLADRWYDLGQSRGDEQREALLRRAAFWYSECQAGLTGLAAAKVQKRLSDLAKLGPTVVELIAEAGPAAALEEPIRPGAWVDLIAKISPARDAVQGQWKHDGDTLSVLSGDHCRLMLPVRLKNCDYDLELEWVRTDGDDAVGAALPVVDRQVAGLVSAGGGQWAGLELVQNRRVVDNRNPTRKPAGFVNNRRHMMLWSVRTRNNMTSIQLTFNNQPLVQGVGNHAQLALPAEWALRDADQPGLLVHNSSVTFRRIRLRVVSGTPAWALQSPAGAAAGFGG